MAYGILKVDTITFTDAGVDKSVTISGLVQNPTFSGNITVTGTVSGNTIQGQTVSGATITGGAAAFTTVTGGVATITSGVFALGSASNPSISFTGDANTGLYSPGADQVAISTGGSGRLFVDASGRVGVGTSSPSDLLHLSGVQPKLKITGTGGTSPSLVFDNASGYKAYIQYNSAGSGNGLQFYDVTNAADRMFLDASGRLGVGTTSPGASLHVAGAIASAPTGSGLLAGINGNYGQAKLYGTTGGILDFGASGADANARLLVNNSDSALQFYTSNAGSLNERLRITSAGLVGIGTSSPSYALQVNSPSASSGTDALTVQNSGVSFVGHTTGIRFRYTSAEPAAIRATLVNGVTGAANLGLFTSSDGAGSNLTERLSVTPAGNVGIGTTSPAKQLHVEGTSSDVTLRIGRNGYVQTDLIGSTGAGANDFKITQNGFDRFVIEYGGNAAARIDSSGRLLVGTSSARSNVNTGAPVTQIETAVGSASTGLSIINNNASGFTSRLALGFSRGSSVGSNTVVNNGDIIGLLSFVGADGANFIEGARIDAQVDGTPGSNDMPGRLVFSTTADGASSPTERMRISNAGTTTLTSAASTAPFIANIGVSEAARIDSSGRLLLGTSTSASRYGIESEFQISGTSTAASSISLSQTDGGIVDAPAVYFWGATRALGESQGLIQFGGGTGGAGLNVVGATIEAITDGEAYSGGAVNDLPTRLVFSTRVNGSSGVNTERLRITNDGILGYNQPAPAAVNATATLTIANLKTGIITSTSAAATDMTLPTGTNTEGGFIGIYDNFTFEWSVINTGPSLVRVLAGTDHTVVGSGSVATGTSGRFASRRTAANTFVTYRLS